MKLYYLLKFILLFVVFFPTLACCNDEGDLSSCANGYNEDYRPKNPVMTPLGREIEYHYDLVNESYRLTWKQNNISYGPSESFKLRLCMPATFESESDYLILLHDGCGSPCWYNIILPLNSYMKVQTIHFMLEFNPVNNLALTIGEPLKLVNLCNNKSQKLSPFNECRNAFLGYCVSEVKFNADSIEFLWKTWDNDNNDIIKHLLYPYDPNLFDDKCKNNN